MVIYTGIVRNGQIKVDQDLELPDGSRVQFILFDEDDDLSDLGDDQGITGAEILASGMVGMWADRDDIGDSAEFAEHLRRRWERRE